MGPTGSEKQTQGVGMSTGAGQESGRSRISEVTLYPLSLPVG